MQSQGLPGFRDFYPDDAALRNHIFAAWRDVASRYGFQEYDGPPLEPLELYVKKSGAEIVGQLYTFEDRGGRSVAFRPEMTPTLARMVAARGRALKKPIRWFSLPQLMRYERPQRGRLREHFQLNMDIIGEPGPLADAELIAAAIDITRKLGLGPADVRARISDRRAVRALVDALGLGEAQVPLAFQYIDKIERESRDTLIDGLAGSAGISSEAAQRVLALGDIRGLDYVLAALDEVPGGRDAGEPLSSCVAALDALGMSEYVDVDLCIVRGLAYYTGIVFELFDAHKALRAICGGGRYDGLLAALGGTDLPAVGFGMGDVVLGELVTESGASPSAQAGLDAFLVAVTGEDVPHVLRVTRQLRDKGLRVEYALKQQSVAKQLKLAASRPAKRAVVIGPDERAQGEVVVRDLGTGNEERVAVDSLVKGYLWS
jgi:histidyl-tRNA synthetase